MDWLYQLTVAPFADYGFMRRALVACLALAVGSGPIGVILVLRRMSLAGDAMSHAVLPGAAIGFLVGGLSLWSMTIGGIAAGLGVALLSGVVSRSTGLREDASFAGFYLASLAVGVTLVSLKGSNIDLMHILFGTILAVDDQALYLVGGIASLSTMTLLAVYRPLVLECFDPGFLRIVDRSGENPRISIHYINIGHGTASPSPRCRCRVATPGAFGNNRHVAIGGADAHRDLAVLASRACLSRRTPRP
jgi:zinc/manganese transport system permease protein